MAPFSNIAAYIIRTHWTHAIYDRDISVGIYVHKIEPAHRRGMGVTRQTKGIHVIGVNPFGDDSKVYSTIGDAYETNWITMVNMRSARTQIFHINTSWIMYRIIKKKNTAANNLAEMEFMLLHA